ncbi:hypothetical protein XENOCAPTIV_015940 [Xenoophorus captivus]|uniref:Uncharacterized protein n=1 Tax=Xenoophorus captivus TaxID=1517983 RepID=A0ABV0RCT0_9TELE
MREIVHHLELLPFSYNCANSCLLTKLLGYFPLAHPSLVQIYYFIPDVLTQLSGLGHFGEVGVCLIECVDSLLLHSLYDPLTVLMFSRANLRPTCFSKHFNYSSDRVV